MRPEHTADFPPADFACGHRNGAGARPGRRRFSRNCRVAAVMGALSAGCSSSRLSELAVGGAASEPSTGVNPLGGTDPGAELALVASEPAHGTTGVDPAANMVLIFNQPVRPGTGELVVTRQDGVEFERVALDGQRVQVSGDRVTVDLEGILGGATDYSITLDAGAVESSLGQPFVGIVSGTALVFQTALVEVPGNVSQGLALWLDASYAPSVETLQAGDGLNAQATVQVWRDRSGEALAYRTAADGPSLDQSALGGRAVLSFAGASALTADTSVLDATAALTVLVVARVRSPGPQIIWARQYGQGQDMRVGVADPPNRGNNDNDPMADIDFEVGVGTGGGGANADAPVQVGQFFVGSALLDLGSGITTRSNGAVGEMAMASPGPFPSDRASTVGASSARDDFLNGEVAEVVVYDRLLTVAELEAVESDLSSKWGID